MKALGGFQAIRLIALLLLLLFRGVAPSAALAQHQAAFSQQQLDQLLAPIALYPDPLLSQMLMASTYPLEVAEAARWSRMHPELQGDDAVQAVAQEDWDPSVKSLVAFPQVIAWMDENPEWTRTLGDAFLAQEPQVMESVQNLRQRSQNVGTLRSDERIHVMQDGGTISVLPANPRIIYVPYYDPMLVYGTWMWPAYPPAYWRPRPGYFIQPGYARFYWGPAITISTGFFFGACDWPRRQVRVVHVNNYYYRPATVNRQVNVAPQANVARLNHEPGAWQHNPAHRRGIEYRGPTAQRYFSAPRVQRQESRRDDPTRRLQSPETRGRSIRFTDPRSDATDGSTARRTSEIRPEIRAREIRPEIRRDLPAVRANAANPSEAPRARHWRPETQSAQSQVRRESPTRFDPPRSVAPREQVRASRESSTPAVTGARSEVRSAGHREGGKPSEHRGRSGGREAGSGR